MTQIPSKKFCVFCGKPPIDKNKEHIIPRWLIQLTGDPKRKVRLGFNMQPGHDLSPREFAFDQFTFPACEECNHRHSQLEGEAQTILLGILDRSPVTASGLSILFDWFDKLRVGLWLGFLQLNKNFLGVTPQFHIERRMGQFDRMLIVERHNSTKKRLNFAGTDSPAFGYMPSAFTITVNDTQFTNVSTAFLFSRRLGFPYPDKLNLNPDLRGYQFVLQPGRNRIMCPVIRRTVLEKGVFVYQPMYPQNLTNSPSNLYDSDYVRANSLDFAKGIGAIFIEFPGQKPRAVDRYEKITFNPPVIYGAEEQLIRGIIGVCDWQNWLIENGYGSDELTKEQRKQVEFEMTFALRLNRALRNYHLAIAKKRGYVR